MSRSALLGVLLLTVPVLAGCLDASEPEDASEPLATSNGRIVVAPELRVPLSEPDFAIAGHYEHYFTGQTDTQLYIDYYLPAVPEDHVVPTILVFTPYQSTTAGEAWPDELADVAEFDDPPYGSALVDYYVPRGYAVAFADVRGNHNAGGCIDQTGPEQWLDGYDYVEWIGEQPWSSGRVGMHGISYDGETQFTTAMMAPPSLVTIVPTASVSNQYEWNFYQGVPYEGQPLTGMGAYFAFSAPPSGDPETVLLYPEKIECQDETFMAAVDLSGDMTEFWRERDYRPMAGQIEASVLHVHGLADWNVRPINIDPLFNDIVSEKRGIFGQWAHQYPTRGDWGTILHAWYDYWLLERENGILDILPPVLVEDNEEAWWGLDSFPPIDQPWLELELSPDGDLVEPGTVEAADLIIHDYPEEVLVGTGLVPTAMIGAEVLGHANYASFEYTTDQELRLVGRPEVRFKATSSEETTHWVAQLEVVGGQQCSGGGVCDNMGYQDTRHLEGLDKPGTTTPGQPYELTIRMFPQYDVVPAGSTLRLTIRNNSPDITQDTTGSVNTLLFGGENPAVLRLPLTPADSIELPHDELPEVFPGYEA